MNIKIKNKHRTMTEQQIKIRDRFLEAKHKEEEARLEKSACNNELIALSPHKIGEIAEWNETNRTRNVGSTWYPNFKSLPDKKKRAVVTRIYISEYELVRQKPEQDIPYQYEFKSIKNDGDISINSCHPSKDFTWTGIIHEKYK